MHHMLHIKCRASTHHGREIGQFSLWISLLRYAHVSYVLIGPMSSSVITVLYGNPCERQTLHDDQWSVTFAAHSAA